MHTSISRTCIFAALAATLMAAQAAAPQDTQLAYVTIRHGMHPSTLDEYKPVLKDACGDLGKAAHSKKINAQVIAGWGGDQFTNEDDPEAGRTYGNHLTIETFKKKEMTGRWHLYESGAVWVHRNGKISYVCNS